MNGSEIAYLTGLIAKAERRLAHHERSLDTSEATSAAVMKEGAAVTRLLAERIRTLRDKRRRAGSDVLGPSP